MAPKRSEDADDGDPELTEAKGERLPPYVRSIGLGALIFMGGGISGGVAPMISGGAQQHALDETKETLKEMNKTLAEIHDSMLGFKFQLEKNEETRTRVDKTLGEHEARLLKLEARVH